MNKNIGVIGRYIIALIAAFALLYSMGAQAAPTFPKLTGRVVDEANIISPEIEAQINALSIANEQKATDQMVVVTLNSLGGYEIADYGYQLGRAWGIGQEKADNGVLLIVAPNERKVRIEVGYGLEGVLTDAITSQIIRDKIIPAFKAGDMQSGILAGAQTINEVLNLSPEEQALRVKKADLEAAQATGSEGEGIPAIVIIFIIFFIIIMMQNSRSSRFRRRGFDGPSILPIILHDWDNDDHGGGGFGGFGGGGGGFGGGGGGFGGGGSSGSW